MALTKAQKGKVIERVDEAVKGAQSMVFVNFHGLTVAETTALRRKLRAEGTGYMVAKKTLAKRALDAAKIGGEMPDLRGEVAIAYGPDLLAPARGVYEFQKEHKDHVEILGGVFEGAYMDQVAMTAIATIPPREVLYAQFVNVINSPIQRLAVALDQISQKKSAE